MAVLLVLATVAAGALLPLQIGMNSRLAGFVGGPVRASLVSFVVGSLILLAIVAIVYRSGGVQRAGSAPWWAWLGGSIGAAYVVSSIVIGPRLGATTFFGILVATQLVVSVVLDRFGWVGYPQNTPSPAKLLGVALLVTGAALVRVF
jgi:transporter family-2 protein